MFGFNGKANSPQASGRDDARRRQFLDRLADVQVASWGAEVPAGVHGSGRPEFAEGGEIFPSGGSDPILTATPESVFLGLAEDIAALDRHAGGAVPLNAPPEAFYATWDNFDKNRELLNAAKTITEVSQTRARRALLSAGVLGTCILFSVTGVGWLIWSSLDGRAESVHDLRASARGATKSASLVHSFGESGARLGWRRPIRPDDAGQVSAPGLPTGEVEPVRLVSSPAKVSGASPHLARPYISQVVTLDVNADGEVPLSFQFHQADRALAGTYAVLDRLPGGLMPTAGEMVRDGQWRLNLAELSKMQLVVGAAAPNSFDLHLEIRDGGGLLVAAHDARIELRQRTPPVVDAQLPREATVPQVLPHTAQAVLSAPSTDSRQPDVTRKLPVKKAKPAAVAEAVPSIAPPVPVPVKRAPKLNEPSLMGVGAAATRLRAKAAVGSDPAVPSSASWWSKKQPDWAKDVQSAN